MKIVELDDEAKTRLEAIKKQQKIKNIEYKRTYREKNREQLRIKYKEYREKNREQITINAKRYREKNREKIRIRDKAYRENNKEERRECRRKYGKDYYIRHKDAINERQRKQHAKNRDAKKFFEAMAMADAILNYDIDK